MPDMIRTSWKESVPAVQVRFLSGWSIYNAGEMAGFPNAIAQSLVTAGRAVLVPAPVGTETIAEEHNPFAEAPTARPMTAEEELATLGVDTSTKEDSEEEMRRKALRRPGKDKMVKGSQTK